MAEQSSNCFSFLCRASNPSRQKPCSVPFLAASLCLGTGREGVFRFWNSSVKTLVPLQSGLTAEE